MTTTVTAAFRDRGTWRAYAAGDQYEGTDARIAELAAAGLLVPCEAGPGDGLAALTVAELKALCAERGVKAPAKATKAQLVALLSE